MSFGAVARNLMAVHLVGSGSAVCAFPITLGHSVVRRVLQLLCYSTYSAEQIIFTDMSHAVRGILTFTLIAYLWDCFPY